ncbi:uncharacterized protein BKCO1_23000118 [Diplodia corticola]|uniref:Uncharacterized protein n=1 Tax=Diplodia corticola TaxID=236234 RepID=A0A1J9QZG8_9PEZI|nr:uncharacterized protein BKCO1_23000118 [Diplodia corticola]OJD34478.1 hypothetical protein BKCO1_23000118 [Diplodia corticola]
MEKRFPFVSPTFPRGSVTGDEADGYARADVFITGDEADGCARSDNFRTYENDSSTELEDRQPRQFYSRNPRIQSLGRSTRDGYLRTAGNNVVLPRQRRRTNRRPPNARAARPRMEQNHNPFDLTSSPPYRPASASSSHSSHMGSEMPETDDASTTTLGTIDVFATNPRNFQSNRDNNNNNNNNNNEDDDGDDQPLFVTPSPTTRRHQLGRIAHILYRQPASDSPHPPASRPDGDHQQQPPPPPPPPQPHEYSPPPSPPHPHSHPHSNSNPTYAHADDKPAHRARLRAMALNRGAHAYVRKQAPEADGENREIKRLRTRERLHWDEIAARLNRARVAAGKTPSFTVAAVYGRFARVAPRIAEADGEAGFDYRDFLNFRHERKGGPGEGSEGERPMPVLGEREEALLVECYEEVERERWENVAKKFKVKAGFELTAGQAARKWKSL